MMRRRPPTTDRLTVQATAGEASMSQAWIRVPRPVSVLCPVDAALAATIRLAVGCHQPGAAPVGPAALDPFDVEMQRPRNWLPEANNAIISNLTRESLLHAISEALRAVVPFDRATGVAIRRTRRRMVS